MHAHGETTRLANSTPQTAEVEISRPSSSPPYLSWTFPARISLLKPANPHKLTNIIEIPMEAGTADVDNIRYIPHDYRLYKPLDKSKKEIRLLRILPAQSSKDELVCCLVRADLDDRPPYDALSYTWGSLDDTVGVKLIFRKTLYVDSSYSDNGSQEHEVDMKMFEGHEQTVVDNFQITTNLYAGLRSFLVNNETEIFIWADMLCMNQSDNSERSHQVRFMDQVFSRATRVIAWLGGTPEVHRTYFLDKWMHSPLCKKCLELANCLKPMDGPARRKC